MTELVAGAVSTGAVAFIVGSCWIVCKVNHMRRSRMEQEG